MKTIKANKKVLFETMPPEVNMVDGIHLKVTSWNPDIENNVLTLRYKKYFDSVSHDTDINYCSQKRDYDNQMITKQAEANAIRVKFEKATTEKDQDKHKKAHEDKRDEMIAIEKSLSELKRVDKNSVISKEFQIKYADFTSMDTACKDLNLVLCVYLKITDYTEL